MGVRVRAGRWSDSGRAAVGKVQKNHNSPAVKVLKLKKKTLTEQTAEAAAAASEQTAAAVSCSSVSENKSNYFFVHKNFTIYRKARIFDTGQMQNSKTHF